MRAIRKRSLPSQIEEEVGRELLFRETAGEREPLESIEAQAKAFGAAKPTVREAMQRLRTAGLVEPGPGHSFVSPPLHFARGVEALLLEVRCAQTPAQRRRAFTSWLQSLYHVARLGFRDAMGRRTDDVRILKEDLEGATALGYSSHDPQRMAYASLMLIWIAAKASQSEPLLLMMNSLMRGYSSISPWLCASIQNRQLGDAWMRVEAAFRAEDRDKLDDALDAIFAKLIDRAARAAAHDHPEPMAQGYDSRLEDL